MKSARSWRVLAAVIAASALVSVSIVQAQESSNEYQPQVGQEGKDVVWVPTPQALVDKMLDMAQVTKDDFLMDLGSGDGRTVITAAKRGVRALGIEYNPDMVELSKRNAKKEGVTDMARFENADLFETDLTKATVITMFLLPSINLKLRPILLDLKPGTRIVSNSFTMDDWEADETAEVPEADSHWDTALLWIVPAKVEGSWKLPQGELGFIQTFQKVGGSFTSGNTTTSIEKGRLLGVTITFTIAGAEYTGTVNGDTMEGTVASDGKTTNWKATRVKK